MKRKLLVYAVVSSVVVAAIIAWQLEVIDYCLLISKGRPMFYQSSFVEGAKWFPILPVDDLNGTRTYTDSGYNVVVVFHRADKAFPKLTQSNSQKAVFEWSDGTQTSICDTNRLIMFENMVSSMETIRPGFASDLRTDLKERYHQGDPPFPNMNEVVRTFFRNSQEAAPK